MADHGLFANDEADEPLLIAESDEGLALLRRVNASILGGNGSIKNLEEPEASDEDDESEELTGQELHDKAAELDIEGRSSMSADELREAVAKAEADDAEATS